MPTGLNTTLGVATEEKYGTFKEPTSFIEIESSSLARKSEYLSPRPLRGRPGIPVLRHKETTRSAEGSIAMAVPTTGFGKILNLLHGETVTPEKKETKSFTAIHKIGEKAPNGKSLTIQIGKPSVEKVHPFTYLGCKVTQATFSCDTSGELKASFDINAADVTTAESLKEASYPTGIESFDFTEPTVEIGGSAIAAGLIIHSFNLVIPIPMKTGRYGLGHGAIQLEPIAFNDTMLPTWELACEFSDLTLYEDYTKGEAKAVTISFKGTKIEGTNYKSISFTAPKAKFVGHDPEVGGPDVLDQTASLEVYDSLTEPLVTITTISEDEKL